MFKKTMFAVLLGLLCGASAPAQETAADEAKLAGSAVYSDPGFQDFIETSYGYLNPRHNAPLTRGLRDAVAAPAAAPAADALRKAAADKKAKEILSSCAQKKGRHCRSLRTAAEVRACRSAKGRLKAGGRAPREKCVRALAVSTAANTSF
ncbi:MAG: hypothetical protein WCK76_01450 [Elusimicrobiota bacterium]